MTAPANTRRLSGVARPTALQKGRRGNPRGRPPGTLNRATTEAREVANRMVDDPQYREALRQRLLDSTAGAMEPLMWYYAKGKPVERVEQNGSSALVALSSDELKAWLVEAIAKL
jgi:hypothetical protein